MLRTLLLLIAGLAAGLTLAFWWQPAQAPLGAIAEVTAGVLAGDASSRRDDGRLAALENALAAETEQRIVLESRVGELAAMVESLEPAARARRGGDAQPTVEAGTPQAREAVRRDPAATRADLERRQLDRLIEAGFPPDRAEWINRRTQELRMQELQAQYDARREGRPVNPTAFAGDSTLRNELGDADYERYLTALNRPTSVPVWEVLASSPGERSGLKTGDEIVAYDGKRVFDTRDLNALTFQGTAGESVTVDVRRNGQTVQLVVPRGPLGVVGGGGPGFGRGPPGR